MDLDAPTILEAAYADAAAHVLTAALTDDPGFTHVLPDARVRHEALQAFYGYIVRDAIRFGTVLAVRDAAGIAGVAVSYPPGAHPLPVTRKLGVIPSMARILARSPRQVLAFARLGSAIDAAFPRDRLTYLEA
ncbi:MAG TPA: hypothetical protein VF413_04640, partial [Cellulomonas sp.]